MGDLLTALGIVLLLVVGAWRAGSPLLRVAASCCFLGAGLLLSPPGRATSARGQRRPSSAGAPPAGRWGTAFTAFAAVGGARLWPPGCSPDGYRGDVHARRRPNDRGLSAQARKFAHVSRESTHSLQRGKQPRIPRRCARLPLVPSRRELPGRWRRPLIKGAAGVSLGGACRPLLRFAQTSGGSGAACPRRCGPRRPLAVLAGSAWSGALVAKAAADAGDEPALTAHSCVRRSSGGNLLAAVGSFWHPCGMGMAACRPAGLGACLRGGDVGAGEYGEGEGGEDGADQVGAADAGVG